MTTPGFTPIPPPSTAEQEYIAAGVPPDQLAAFARLQAAQTPDEYAAAAAAAGLTNTALAAAAGQAQAGVTPGPVQAPSFEEQLSEYRQRALASEAQVQALANKFQQDIAAIQAQFGQLQSSMPTRIDPVSETAAKVVHAFRDVVASDAKNIVRSALHSHLTVLGLEDLARLL